MRFLRILSGFVLVLVPLFLVYGLIRVGWLGYPVGTYELIDSNADGVYEGVSFSEGYGSFLPSPSDFLKMLTTFPSVEQYLLPAVEFWHEASFATFNTEIVDIGSFFTVIGGFVSLMGGFFYFVALLISYPVAVVIYIFGNMFTPYNA